MKLGKDIEVGDILVFLGNHHRITRIEPYTGPLAYLWNGHARIGYAAPPHGSTKPWGVTLDPAARWEVA